VHLDRLRRQDAEVEERRRDGRQVAGFREEGERLPQREARFQSDFPPLMVRRTSASAQYALPNSTLAR